MLDGGEVGWCVVGSQAAVVVAKDHVHDPVQAVLHRPVVADDGADPVGWQGQRGDVETGFALGPAGPAAQFAAALDHDDGAQHGPVVALAKPVHIVQDGDLAGLDAPVIAIDGGAAADVCVVEIIGFLFGGENFDIVAQRALEAQRESLRAIGCEKVWEEQTSSVGPREVLRAAVEYAREGDSLVVTKLDRLARSVRNLGEIVEELEGKSVGLKVLDLGLDTTNATGKLMLNVLGSVAQFEREMMLERQREGIAKAKADGKYRGRRPIAQSKAVEARSLVAAGFSKREVATRLGLSERSVFRLMSEVS